MSSLLFPQSVYKLCSIESETLMLPVKVPSDTGLFSSMFSRFCSLLFSSCSAKQNMFSAPVISLYLQRQLQRQTSMCTQKNPHIVGVRLRVLKTTPCCLQSATLQCYIKVLCFTNQVMLYISMLKHFTNRTLV